MTSKVTFWRLTTPLPFGGKPNMLDGLKILDNEVKIGTGGVLIMYTEGWMIKDDLGNVTDFFTPKSWHWTGSDFKIEKSRPLVADPTATMESYLIGLFYAKLGESKPEYAGALVVQDTQ